MNVIFLDFDGVIDTCHLTSDSDVEKKIKILADITKEYNCKVVIEAACKDAIDPETLEIYDSEWVSYVFSLFEKYGIECIGRTPSVRKYFSSYSYIDMWKEDEIRLYLMKHPEIEHFCIIDDKDDRNDLNKIIDYLVKTDDYSVNPEEEGLLERHKEEVAKVLLKENRYKKYALKYKENHKND